MSVYNIVYRVFIELMRGLSSIQDSRNPSSRQDLKEARRCQVPRPVDPRAHGKQCTSKLSSHPASPAPLETIVTAILTMKRRVIAYCNSVVYGIGTYWDRHSRAKIESSQPDAQCSDLDNAYCTQVLLSLAWAKSQRREST